MVSLGKNFSESFVSFLIKKGHADEIHPLTYIEIIKILLKLEKPAVIRYYIYDIFQLILRYYFIT